jgi:hypothetical protein
MSYSFKDDIASRLPEGYSLVRMFSLGTDETSIEGKKNGVKTTFTLTKEDITPYFLKPPAIAMKAESTLNDLYGRLSDIYGLGLASNIDYYNDSPLNPSSTPRYVELPISPNSYGYKGTIRCHVVLDAFGGVSLGSYRDLTQGDVSDAMLKLKLRNYLLGNLFKLDVLCFIEDRLTLEFIDKVVVNVNRELGKSVDVGLRSILTNSVVLETYCDGLSDVVVIITKEKEIFQIRYLTGSIKNNDKKDNKTDNSQGLTVGDNEGSAENPVGGKGDIITGERSEHPNSSTVGNTIEEEIDIEIK